jgi:hypothetical protein
LPSDDAGQKLFGPRVEQGPERTVLVTIPDPLREASLTRGIDASTRQGRQFLLCALRTIEELSQRGLVDAPTLTRGLLHSGIFRDVRARYRVARTAVNTDDRGDEESRGCRSQRTRPPHHGLTDNVKLPPDVLLVFTMT